MHVHGLYRQFACKHYTLYINLSLKSHGKYSVIILVQVSNNATSSKKYYVVGSLDYSCTRTLRNARLHGLYRRFACKHSTLHILSPLIKVARNPFGL